MQTTATPTKAALTKPTLKTDKFESNSNTLHLPENLARIEKHLFKENSPYEDSEVTHEATIIANPSNVFIYPTLPREAMPNNELDDETNMIPGEIITAPTIRRVSSNRITLVSTNTVQRANRDDFSPELSFSTQIPSNDLETIVQDLNYVEPTVVDLTLGKSTTSGPISEFVLSDDNIIQQTQTNDQSYLLSQVRYTGFLDQSQSAALKLPSEIEQFDNIGGNIGPSNISQLFQFPLNDGQTLAALFTFPPGILNGNRETAQQRSSKIPLVVPTLPKEATAFDELTESSSTTNVDDSKLSQLDVPSQTLNNFETTNERDNHITESTKKLINLDPIKQSASTMITSGLDPPTIKSNKHVARPRQISPNDGRDLPPQFRFPGHLNQDAFETSERRNFVTKPSGVVIKLTPPRQTTRAVPPSELPPPEDVRGKIGKPEDSGAITTDDGSNLPPAFSFPSGTINEDMEEAQQGDYIDMATRNFDGKELPPQFKFPPQTSNNLQVTKQRFNYITKPTGMIIKLTPPRRSTSLTTPSEIPPAEDSRGKLKQLSTISRAGINMPGLHQSPPNNDNLPPQFKFPGVLTDNLDASKGRNFVTKPTGMVIKLTPPRQTTTSKLPSELPPPEDFRGKIGKNLNLAKSQKPPTDDGRNLPPPFMFPSNTVNEDMEEPKQTDNMEFATITLAAPTLPKEATTTEEVQDETDKSASTSVLTTKLPTTVFNLPTQVVTITPTAVPPNEGFRGNTLTSSKMSEGTAIKLMKPTGLVIKLTRPTKYTVLTMETSSETSINPATHTWSTTAVLPTFSPVALTNAPMDLPLEISPTTASIVSTASSTDDTSTFDNNSSDEEDYEAETIEQVSESFTISSEGIRKSQTTPTLWTTVPVTPHGDIVSNISNTISDEFGKIATITLDKADEVVEKTILPFGNSGSSITTQFSEKTETTANGEDSSFPRQSLSTAYQLQNRDEMVSEAHKTETSERPMLSSTSIENLRTEFSAESSTTPTETSAPPSFNSDHSENSSTYSSGELNTSTEIPLSTIAEASIASSTLEISHPSSIPVPNKLGKTANPLIHISSEIEPMPNTEETIALSSTIPKATFIANSGLSEKHFEPSSMEPLTDKYKSLKPELLEYIEPPYSKGPVSGNTADSTTSIAVQSQASTLTTLQPDDIKPENVMDTHGSIGKDLTSETTDVFRYDLLTSIPKSKPFQITTERPNVQDITPSEEPTLVGSSMYTTSGITEITKTTMQQFTGTANGYETQSQTLPLVSSTETPVSFSESLLTSSMNQVSESESYQEYTSKDVNDTFDKNNESAVPINIRKTTVSSLTTTILENTKPDLTINGASTQINTPTSDTNFKNGLSSIFQNSETTHRGTYTNLPNSYLSTSNGITDKSVEEHATSSRSSGILVAHSDLTESSMRQYGLELQTTKLSNDKISSTEEIFSQAERHTEQVITTSNVSNHTEVPIGHEFEPEKTVLQENIIISTERSSVSKQPSSPPQTSGLKHSLGNVDVDQPVSLHTTGYLPLELETPSEEVIGQYTETVGAKNTLELITTQTSKGTEGNGSETSIGGAIQMKETLISSNLLTTEKTDKINNLKTGHSSITSMRQPSTKISTVEPALSFETKGNTNEPTSRPTSGTQVSRSVLSTNTGENPTFLYTDANIDTSISTAFSARAGSDVVKQESFDSTIATSATSIGVTHSSDEGYVIASEKFSTLGRHFLEPTTEVTVVTDITKDISLMADTSRAAQTVASISSSTQLVLEQNKSTAHSTSVSSIKSQLVADRFSTFQQSRNTQSTTNENSSLMDQVQEEAMDENLKHFSQYTASVITGQNVSITAFSNPYTKATHAAEVVSSTLTLHSITYHDSDSGKITNGVIEHRGPPTTSRPYFDSTITNVENNKLGSNLSDIELTPHSRVSTRMFDPKNEVSSEVSSISSVKNEHTNASMYATPQDVSEHVSETTSVQRSDNAPKPTLNSFKIENSSLINKEASTFRSFPISSPQSQISVNQQTAIKSSSPIGLQYVGGNLSIGTSTQFLSNQPKKHTQSAGNEYLLSTYLQVTEEVLDEHLKNFNQNGNFSQINQDASKTITETTQSSLSLNEDKNATPAVSTQQTGQTVKKQESTNEHTLTLVITPTLINITEPNLSSKEIIPEITSSSPTSRLLTLLLTSTGLEDETRKLNSAGPKLSNNDDSVLTSSHTEDGAVSDRITGGTSTQPNEIHEAKTAKPTLLIISPSTNNEDTILHSVITMESDTPISFAEAFSSSIPQSQPEDTKTSSLVKKSSQYVESTRSREYKQKITQPTLNKNFLGTHALEESDDDHLKHFSHNSTPIPHQNSSSYVTLSASNQNPSTSFSTNNEEKFAYTVTYHFSTEHGLSVTEKISNEESAQNDLVHTISSEEVIKNSYKNSAITPPGTSTTKQAHTEREPTTLAREDIGKSQLTTADRNIGINSHIGNEHVTEKVSGGATIKQSDFQEVMTKFPNSASSEKHLELELGRSTTIKAILGVGNNLQSGTFLSFHQPKQTEANDINSFTISVLSPVREEAEDENVKHFSDHPSTKIEMTTSEFNAKQTGGLKQSTKSGLSSLKLLNGGETELSSAGATIYSNVPEYKEQVSKNSIAESGITLLPTSSYVDESHVVNGKTLLSTNIITGVVDITSNQFGFEHDESSTHARSTVLATPISETNLAAELSSLQPPYSSDEVSHLPSGTVTNLAGPTVFPGQTDTRPLKHSDVVAQTDITNSQQEKLSTSFDKHSSIRTTRIKSTNPSHFDQQKHTQSISDENLFLSLISQVFEQAADENMVHFSHQDNSTQEVNQNFTKSLANVKMETMPLANSMEAEKEPSTVTGSFSYLRENTSTTTLTEEMKTSKEVPTENTMEGFPSSASNVFGSKLQEPTTQLTTEIMKPDNASIVSFQTELTFDGSPTSPTFIDLSSNKVHEGGESITSSHVLPLEIQKHTQSAANENLFLSLMSHIFEEAADENLKHFSHQESSTHASEITTSSLKDSSKLTTYLAINKKPTSSPLSSDGFAYTKSTPSLYSRASDTQFDSKKVTAKLVSIQTQHGDGFPGGIPTQHIPLKHKNHTKSSDHDLLFSTMADFLENVDDEHLAHFPKHENTTLCETCNATQTIIHSLGNSGTPKTNKENTTPNYVVTNDRKTGLTKLNQDSFRTLATLLDSKKEETTKPRNELSPSSVPFQRQKYTKTSDHDFVPITIVEKAGDDNLRHFSKQENSTLCELCNGTETLVPRFSKVGALSTFPTNSKGITPPANSPGNLDDKITSQTKLSTALLITSSLAQFEAKKKKPTEVPQNIEARLSFGTHTILKHTMASYNNKFLSTMSEIFEQADDANLKHFPQQEKSTLCEICHPTNYAHGQSEPLLTPETRKPGESSTINQKPYTRPTTKLASATPSITSTSSSEARGGFSEKLADQIVTTISQVSTFNQVKHTQARTNEILSSAGVSQSSEEAVHDSLKHFPKQETATLCQICNPTNVTQADKSLSNKIETTSGRGRQTPIFTVAVAKSSSSAKTQGTSKSAKGGGGYYTIETGRPTISFDTKYSKTQITDNPTPFISTGPLEDVGLMHVSSKEKSTLCEECSSSSMAQTANSPKLHVSPQATTPTSSTLYSNKVFLASSSVNAKGSAVTKNEHHSETTLRSVPTIERYPSGQSKGPTVLSAMPNKNDKGILTQTPQFVYQKTIGKHLLNHTESTTTEDSHGRISKVEEHTVVSKNTLGTLQQQLTKSNDFSSDELLEEVLDDSRLHFSHGENTSPNHYSSNYVPIFVGLTSSKTGSQNNYFTNHTTAPASQELIEHVTSKLNGQPHVSLSILGKAPGPTTLDSTSNLEHHAFSKNENFTTLSTDATYLMSSTTQDLVQYLSSQLEGQTVVLSNEHTFSTSGGSLMEEALDDSVLHFTRSNNTTPIRTSVMDETLFDSTATSHETENLHSAIPVSPAPQNISTYFQYGDTTKSLLGPILETLGGSASSTLLIKDDHVPSTRGPFLNTHPDATYNHLLNTIPEEAPDDSRLHFSRDENTTLGIETDLVNMLDGSLATHDSSETFTTEDSLNYHGPSYFSVTPDERYGDGDTSISFSDDVLQAEGRTKGDDDVDVSTTSENIVEESTGNNRLLSTILEEAPYEGLLHFSHSENTSSDENPDHVLPGSNSTNQDLENDNLQGEYSTAPINLHGSIPGSKEPTEHVTMQSEGHTGVFANEYGQNNFENHTMLGEELSVSLLQFSSIENTSLEDITNPDIFSMAENGIPTTPSTVEPVPLYDVVTRLEGQTDVSTEFVIDLGVTEDNNSSNDTLVEEILDDNLLHFSHRENTSLKSETNFGPIVTASEKQNIKTLSTLESEQLPSGSQEYMMSMPEVPTGVLSNEFGITTGTPLEEALNDNLLHFSHPENTSLKGEANFGPTFATSETQSIGTLSALESEDLPPGSQEYMISTLEVPTDVLPNAFELTTSTPLEEAPNDNLLHFSHQENTSLKGETNFGLIFAASETQSIGTLSTLESEELPLGSQENMVSTPTDTPLEEALKDNLLHFSHQENTSLKDETNYGPILAASETQSIGTLSILESVDLPPGSQEYMMSTPEVPTRVLSNEFGLTIGTPLEGGLNENLLNYSHQENTSIKGETDFVPIFTASENESIGTLSTLESEESPPGSQEYMMSMPEVPTGVLSNKFGLTTGILLEEAHNDNLLHSSHQENTSIKGETDFGPIFGVLENESIGTLSTLESEEFPPGSQEYMISTLEVPTEVLSNEFGLTTGTPLEEALNDNLLHSSHQVNTSIKGETDFGPIIGALENESIGTLSTLESEEFPPGSQEYMISTLEVPTEVLSNEFGLTTGTPLEEALNDNILHSSHQENTPIKGETDFGPIFGASENERIGTLSTLESEEFPPGSQEYIMPTLEVPTGVLTNEFGLTTGTPLEEALNDNLLYSSHQENTSIKGKTDFGPIIGASENESIGTLSTLESEEFPPGSQEYMISTLEVPTEVLSNEFGLTTGTPLEEALNDNLMHPSHQENPPIKGETDFGPIFGASENESIGTLSTLESKEFPPGSQEYMISTQEFPTEVLPNEFELTTGTPLEEALNDNLLHFSHRENTSHADETSSRPIFAASENESIGTLSALESEDLPPGLQEYMISTPEVPAGVLSNEFGLTTGTPMEEALNDNLLHFSHRENTLLKGETTLDTIFAASENQNIGTLATLESEELPPGSEENMMSMPEVPTGVLSNEFGLTTGIPLEEALNDNLLHVSHRENTSIKGETSLDYILATLTSARHSSEDRGSSFTTWTVNLHSTLSAEQFLENNTLQSGAGFNIIGNDHNLTTNNQQNVTSNRPLLNNTLVEEALDDNLLHFGPTAVTESLNGYTKSPFNDTNSHIRFATTRLTNLEESSSLPPNVQTEIETSTKSLVKEGKVTIRNKNVSNSVTDTIIEEGPSDGGLLHFTQREGTTRGYVLTSLHSSTVFRNTIVPLGNLTTSSFGHGGSKETAKITMKAGAENKIGTSTPHNFSGSKGHATLVLKHNSTHPENHVPDNYPKEESVGDSVLNFSAHGSTLCVLCNNTHTEATSTNGHHSEQPVKLSSNPQSILTELKHVTTSKTQITLLRHSSKTSNTESHDSTKGMDGTTTVETSHQLPSHESLSPKATSQEIKVSSDAIQTENKMGEVPSSLSAPGLTTFPDDTTSHLSAITETAPTAIYIDLPVYPKNTTATLEPFDNFYSKSSTTTTTSKACIFDDEVTDILFDKEAFRSMKLEDFKDVTEYPPTSPSETEGRPCFVSTGHGAPLTLSSTSLELTSSSEVKSKLSTKQKPEDLTVQSITAKTQPLVLVNEEHKGLSHVTKPAALSTEKIAFTNPVVPSVPLTIASTKSSETLLSHTEHTSTTTYTSSLKTTTSSITYLPTRGRPLNASKLVEQHPWNSTFALDNATSSTLPSQASSLTTISLTPSEEFSKPLDKSTCSIADFLSLNFCLCSIDNLLRDLKIKLPRNEEEIHMENYTCPVYTHVETGIILGNDSAPTVMHKRRFTDYMDYFIVWKREIVDNARVEKVLNEQLDLKNTETEIFGMPGSKIEIPCEYANDSVEDEDAKYVWTYGYDQPLTEGKIQEREGNLIIENVSPQDGGNYTCTVKSGTEITKYERRLSIVTLPAYTASTTILYNITDSCQAGDPDILALYTPNVLSNLICGNNLKACSIEVKESQCANKSEQNIFLNFSTVIEPFNAILPAIDSSICNVNCQMKVYSRIILFIVKNLEAIQKLPVYFRFSYRQKQLIPTEVITKSTKSKIVTLGPKLVITCPPGFGYHKKTHICGSCPRNTFSRGDETYCTSCPAGQYQPMVGSKSCLVCSSPLIDPYCLRVVYSNSEKFRLLIGVAASIFVLLVIIIICLKTTKKGTNYEKYAKSNNARQPRKRNRETDVEKQDEEPLLKKTKEKRRNGRGSKQPPQPPPPDF